MIGQKLAGGKTWILENATRLKNACVTLSKLNDGAG